MQDKDVREIVTPYIKTGAWFAHPEAVLLSCLGSPKREDRMFGVSQILKIRGESDLGDMKPRARRTPVLNMEATTLTDLIDWDKETIHEPVFSCTLNQAELKRIQDIPMSVPYYTLHTQSTERAVKQVTEAAAAVCGYERRDGYIRARVKHREIMPKFQSKKDVLRLFNE